MRRCLFATLIVVLVGACGAPEEACVPPDAPEPAFQAAQRAEGERTGFPVEVENLLGMRFRLIPTGAFQMGEDAPHAVRFVTPYYMQVGQVTNGQFHRFRPAHDSGRSADGASLNEDDLPVRKVSHQAAVAFAAWLRDQDSTWRYRLPTEAEWEYVARGQVESRGGAPSNAWGIRDLRSPTAEWCHDRFGPYPSWPQDDPQGATFGEARVVRGGALPETTGKPVCGRASREPDTASESLGFRLAFGLGYARHDYGAHAVMFRTVDPTAEGTEDFLRPGYDMLMISIPDRLTDRQNDPNANPFWTAVPRPSPTVVKLWPGRYYVYCHRTKDGDWQRGIEVKFDIPGPTSIDVHVPREDQVSPQ